MDWKKLKEEDRKVGYKHVTIKDFELPDGTVSDYTTWYKSGSQSIATVAVTKEGTIVIARQYRPGPERVLDELPGGVLEEGEDLSEAAARELREETGYASDEPLLNIGQECKDAYTNNINHYFLAKNCYLAGEQELDEREFVEIATITVDQLIENAKTSKMSDAGAVLMAYDYLKGTQ